MKRFWKDQRGNAVIWTAFLILILFTLSLVIYGAITVYSKYQSCETELERAVIVTVDQSMVNENVRDMELDIPAISAVIAMEENLTNMGWTKKDGSWVKESDGKCLYRLEGLEASVDGRRLEITASCVLSLPWEIGGVQEVAIPIQAQTSILYIE